MPKLQHLSYSSIELWSTCPQAWAARYILGIQDVRGEAASFGSWFEGCVAAEMGFNEIGAETADGRKIKMTADEFRAAHQTPEVDKAVKNYFKQSWAWREADETQTLIQITPAKWRELAARYGADPELAIKIIGFTDFLRRTPESTSLPDELRPREILDLKTSSRPEFKASWAQQVTLYCLATGSSRWSVHRHVRGRPAQLECKSLDMDSETGRALARQTMDRIAYISRQIMAVCEDPGLAEHLPRNANWLCSYCPLKDECVSGNIFGDGASSQKASGNTMISNVGATGVDELQGMLDPSKGE